MLNTASGKLDERLFNTHGPVQKPALPITRNKIQTFSKQFVAFAKVRTPQRRPDHLCTFRTSNPKAMDVWNDSMLLYAYVASGV
jgi:hypothetical protein